MTQFHLICWRWSLESWLQARGEPTWLLEDGNAPFLVGDKIRSEFELFRESWRDWFGDVQKTNRTRTANMKEWFVVLNGGSEVWSFRPERIFTQMSGKLPSNTARTSAARRETE